MSVTSANRVNPPVEAVAEPKPALTRAQRLQAERRSRRKPRRSLVGLVVAVPVLFNLWTLRGEASPVQNLNDATMHLSMVRWAMHRIEAGHLPFDGWYPYLGQGFPQFHQYQSLPHIVTGAVATVISANTAFFGSLYLLLALWPLCVYWSARLFGFDKWTAAGAAVVSPLLVSASGYGFEQTSYTWQGYGMWAQLWGMWLLPIALALSYRAVVKRRSLALAAVALGLTFAVHFLAGYLGALAVAVWFLVQPRPFVRRLTRAAILGVVALASIVWMLVPLFADQNSANYSNYGRNTFWYDSYGARKVLGWLVSGEIYDHARFPIITILVGVGLVVALQRARRDVLHRAVVAFWALSMLLFIGRPTLGPALDVLPGQRDLFLPRFIMGVHFGGILLAGIGGAWLVTNAAQLAQRARPRLSTATAVFVACVVGLAILIPAWKERADVASEGASWMHEQRATDATVGADFRGLVSRAQSMGDGRIYAGLRTNWGRGNTIAFVPAYAELVNADADSVGFTLRVASLSTPAEQLFDDQNVADYDLYDVRYLILPTDRRPPAPATFVASAGNYRLYTMPTSGYLQVVDTVGPPIVAGSETLGDKAAPFLESPLLAQGKFPTVALNGATAAAPSATGAVSGSPGTVAVQYAQLEDGEFGGEVTATRNAVVVLKASYHQRWHATVDGREVPTQVLAPGFVGVAVTPGAHAVVFRYQSYPNYAALFGISIISVAALAFGERRLRRRSRGSRDARATSVLNAPDVTTNASAVNGNGAADNAAAAAPTTTSAEPSPRPPSPCSEAPD